MSIFSLLYNDLYKFSTSYAYMKLYPEAEGTFTFCDRNNVEYNQEFLELLELEFIKLGQLALRKPEKEICIERIPYIPEIYWEWLERFHYEYSKIDYKLDENNHLQINVTDKLYKVTLYEVPILAIVSETYHKWKKEILNWDKTINKLLKKIDLANSNNLKFSEFGTRRRYSASLHEDIVTYLKQRCPNCAGTSNVYFAMKYNMTPIGTFPHEWIMFHGAIWGYQEANYLGMRDWVRTYDGNLGIFLMNTYTSKVGLNMSMKFAKLFDGVRQDSGDEYKIGNMVIDRYKELKIDPTTKTIVFSNALDFDRYLDIARYFNGRIHVSAGIGTNLTNDTGYKPSNIVMKLSKCRINSNQEWKKCIKISDDLGKHLGDNKEFEIAKYQLGM